MQQSDHEYEERSFGDIQRAIDFENSMRDLNIFYQELPDAVFGLRSLLFFYIFIRHSLFTDTEDCSNG